MRKEIGFVLFSFSMLNGVIGIANINTANQKSVQSILPVLQATASTLSSSVTGLGASPLSSANPASGHSERKANDLKVEESKYGEPAPEYYRGPSSYDRERYRERYGIYRPASSSDKYSGDRNDFLTNNGIYDTSRPPTAPSYGSTGYNSYNSYGYGSNKDRLNTLYGHTGAGDGNGYYQQGGAYEGGINRPPYGPPQVVDLPGYPQSWNSGGSGSSVLGYEHSSVYDYGGHGGYGGHSSIFGGKQELSKSLLIPLAGAALLGVAAALVANPVLLQLGTVTGKRKRRDTNGNKGHNLAYNGYRK